jgi:hypothetical protein
MADTAIRNAVPTSSIPQNAHGRLERVLEQNKKEGNNGISVKENKDLFVNDAANYAKAHGKGAEEAFIKQETKDFGLNAKQQELLRSMVEDTFK